MWSIELIDDTNRSGSAEFVVTAANPDTFFPIEVNFSASTTLCDVKVGSGLGLSAGRAGRACCRQGASPACSREACSLSSAQLVWRHWGS